MVDGEPGEVPKEIVNQTNEQTNNRLSQARTTRRGVLERAAALATVPASIWASRHAPAPPVHHKATPTPEISPTPLPEMKSTPAPELIEDHEVNPSFEAPFESAIANEIAKEKGIDTGTLLMLNSDVVNNLTAFKGNEILPIYFPEVIAKKDLIYKYADKYGVPPNIVATIMSIESAGDPTAVSEANAQGLFQVMPDNFTSHFGKELTPEQMQDPETNATVAMETFNYFLGLAREAHKDKWNTDHPMMYVSALMGYNAGNHAAKTDRVETIDDQARFYGDYAERFMMTAEIAQGLRDKEFSDAAIIKKLHSIHFDAIGDALTKYIRNRDNTTDMSYEEYRQVMQQLSSSDLYSLPTEGVGAETNTLGSELNTYIKNYKENPRFKTPASVAERVWLGMGGSGLITDADANHPERWTSIDTKRAA